MIRLCTGSGITPYIYICKNLPESTFQGWCNLTTLNIFFRQAADNGHPGGAYNLVAAHFQGFKTDLQEQ